MDNSQIIIIADALVYLLTFVYWLRKKDIFNVGVVILLIMTISHAVALFYYTITRDLQMLKVDIQILPFIYLYLMIMLTIWPFLSSNEIKRIDDTGLQPLIKYLSIFAIVVNFEPLVENVVLSFNSNTEYSELYDAMREGDLDIYSPIGSTLMGWSNQLRIFVPISFFYFLTQKKKEKTLIVGLLLCFINGILFWINRGGRGGVVIQVLLFFFAFSYFRTQFSKDYLKKIMRYTALCTFPLVGVFVLISASRYDSLSEKSSNVESIGLVGGMMNYISEGPVRFNGVMWDGKHNTNGDVNFNYLKDLLGMKTYTTYEKRDDHYFAKNGRRIEVFYTYIGDFVSDFGPYGAAIMCFILYFFGRGLTKQNGVVPFQNLLLITVLLQLYSIGFASNLYRAYGYQRNIMYMVVLFVIMKVINEREMNVNKVRKPKYKVLTNDINSNGHV